MASFRELLKATRAEIHEIDTAEGERRLAGGALLLDVRHALQEATKFDAGAEWTPLPGLELSLDLFYANLGKTLELDLFQVIQNERTLGLFAEELISHGRSYGLELMLRHRIGAGWFGWLSYSWQRSTRPPAGRPRTG